MPKDIQDAARLQGFILAAAYQLERLADKFNLADTPRPQLHIFHAVFAFQFMGDLLF